MTSYANYNLTLEEVENRLAISYVPSILKMGFQTKEYNVPEGVTIKSISYELDSIVNGASVSTFDNTSAPLIKFVPTVFAYNHFVFEAYITAKANENKGIEYFTNGANLFINDVFNRDFDKIAFNGYGNEGLFTEVVNGSPLIGIITGKQLVDKIVELSMKANEDNKRPVDNQVSVLLSGSFNKLYATDFYSDSRSITQMIPSWIRVELASDDKIITGNTITIVSTNDIIVHHGLLPQIVTPYHYIDNGGSQKFYELGLGASSVAVQKLNGKKVYKYTQS
jgi:hypothetical protein